MSKNLSICYDPKMNSPENNNCNTSADKNAKLDFDAILEKGKIIIKTNYR